MSPVIRRGKTWRVIVEFPKGPGGERRRRWFTVAGTKKDALKALTAAEYERDHGIDIAPERLTVAELLDRWLRDYAAGRVAPSTFKRYSELAGRAGHSDLGRQRLQALRPAHVQAYYSGLAASGLAPRTVVHHHRVLREALAWAMRAQLISSNPAAVEAPPSPPRTEMKHLDVEGVQRLLIACLDDEQRRMVLFAVQTGLRLGEQFGLRWSDVDLQTGLASIVRSVTVLGGEIVTRQPKTARGRRSIALSPATVTLLREQRRTYLERRLLAGEAFEASDAVWGDELGRVRRPEAVSLRFVRMARAAGFDGLRWHDLRHTSATLALQAGTHPKIVSERLGHSTIAITLDTYSHVLPSMQREAAEALDVLLAGADKVGTNRA